MNGEKGETTAISLTDFFRNQSIGQITRSGDAPYDPPTYAQKITLRNRVCEAAQALGMDDIHRFAINAMPAGLETIASSQMPLTDIPKFYETVKVVRDERRTRLNDQRSNVQIKETLERSSGQGDISEQMLDDARFMVAENLAYTIAFNEHLFDPNDLGVTPTATYNLVTHENKVVDNIEKVAAVLATAPQLFWQKTQPIYEGIIGRLSRHRGMFAGYRVNNKEFPTFPQPGPVK